MTSSQCAWCPWDCPSPEAAACRQPIETPQVLAGVCEPAWRVPERKRKGTTDVIRDLADYKGDAVLVLPQKMRDDLVAFAHSEAPLEACGVLTAPIGANRPVDLIPMINAAQSDRFFEFDPDELLSLHRNMEIRGEDIVAVWHSHTASEAYPSGVDAAYATPLGIHHVIVSTLDDSVRSFSITDGHVTEEEVRIAE